MMKWIVAALALAVGGCATTPPPRHGTLLLIDLTDDFARIYDRDAALPDTARLARFKADYATLLPGFYDAKRVDAPSDKFDAYLLRGIRSFPAQRAGIARVSREFAGMLKPAQASFETQFGPMTGYPPIYLVDSFGEFDGGTRDLPEGTRLLFGADMIDKLYRTTPIQPFFHHELFHLLHARTFPECEPVWCALWTEGLAVYVASRLNPTADDAALVLTFPEPLRPAVEKDRPHAVCAIRARLDSTNSADYKAIFSNGSLAPGLPGRFGYYVGYLVAADLGRTRTLSQLAALRPAEVRPLLKQALRDLAVCPVKP